MQAGRRWPERLRTEPRQLRPGSPPPARAPLLAVGRSPTARRRPKLCRPPPWTRAPPSAAGMDLRPTAPSDADPIAVQTASRAAGLTPYVAAAASPRWLTPTSIDATPWRFGEKSAASSPCSMRLESGGLVILWTSRTRADAVVSLARVVYGQYEGNRRFDFDSLFENSEEDQLCPHFAVVVVSLRTNEATSACFQNQPCLGDPIDEQLLIIAATATGSSLEHKQVLGCSSEFMIMPLFLHLHWLS